MHECELFLGLKVNTLLKQELKKSSSSVLDLFIQDHPEYLQQVAFNGSEYLGKKLGEKLDLSHLDQIQQNIQTLVSRVAPQYVYHHSALVLFPLIQQSP